MAAQTTFSRVHFCSVRSGRAKRMKLGLKLSFLSEALWGSASRGAALPSSSKREAKQGKRSELSELLRYSPLTLELS